MKRIVGVVVVAVAAVLSGMSTEAQADHYRHSHYSRNHSHHHSYSPSRVYIGVGGFSYSSGYSTCSPRTPVWHDTSHYDYHPTEVLRHRDHYHVVPGHYDYHRSGHYDY